jgi:hypothetical protein
MWRIFFQKKEKENPKSAQIKEREYAAKYSVCANFFPIKIRMIGIY